MKIFLVDNNKKFRDNLKLYLEGHLKHQVIGEASNSIDFKENIHHIVDIVLMDIKKKVLINTITTYNCLKGIKDGNVIAISQHNDLGDTRILQSIGFKGFVSKDNLYRDLEDAINTVASGKLFYPNKNS